MFERALESHCPQALYTLIGYRVGPEERLEYSTL